MVGMKQTKLFLWLPLLFLLFIGVFSLVLLSSHNKKLVLDVKHDKFPSFMLQELKKNQTVTNQYLKGHFTLVHFFSSWCEVCAYSQASIAQIDIPILGINFKDTPKAVNKFLDKQGNPFEFVLIDKDSELAIELGVTGVPEDYLVSPEGEILYHHMGYLSQKKWKEKFEPIIHSYLNGSLA